MKYREKTCIQMRPKPKPMSFFEHFKSYYQQYFHKKKTDELDAFEIEQFTKAIHNKITFKPDAYTVFHFLYILQTIFAKGGGHSLDVQVQMGYETIGLDWTVDPVEARKIVGDNITLQGNLDPQDLYKSPVSLCFKQSSSWLLNVLTYFFIYFVPGGNQKVNNRDGTEVRKTQIHSQLRAWHNT